MLIIVRGEPPKSTIAEQKLAVGLRHPVHESDTRTFVLSVQNTFRVS